MDKINSLLPVTVHLVDILNKECRCSHEEKQLVIDTVIAKCFMYDKIAIELKTIKATTSNGDYYALASELLELKING